MSLSHYNHAPYHPIGAASLLVWDSTAGPVDPAAELPRGAWRSVGKVADAAVSMTAQTASQELALKGLSQPVTLRLTGQRYSLSFRLLEHAGPEALDLLFGLGSTQSATGGQLASTAEVLRLYGDDWAELAHPFGILASPPAGVSAVSGDAGGSGGSIPAGTYYYWIAPVLPGESGLAYGTPAPSGAVTVGSGEKVLLTFTPPGSYLPLQYAVFASASNSLASAALVDSFVAPEGSIEITHHGTGSDYGSGSALRLFSHAGETEYIEGIDFITDLPKGLVKRISGGTIPSGGRTVAVYTYQRPASVLTSLGDPVTLARYRRIKLLQLAPEDGAGGAGDLDPASWRETGVEWDLHRVAIGAGDSSYACTPDDFSPGSAVVWDCLYDAQYARVGTVRSTFGVLATYE
jgi:hypothetical protein